MRKRFIYILIFMCSYLESAQTLESNLLHPKSLKNDIDTSADSILRVQPNSHLKNKDESLEIIHDKYEIKPYIERHESVMSKKPHIDSITAKKRVRLGGGYFGLLGLSQTHTMIATGYFVDAGVPLKFRSFALDINGDFRMGKAIFSGESVSKTDSNVASKNSDIESKFYSAQGEASFSTLLSKHFNTDLSRDRADSYIIFIVQSGLAKTEYKSNINIDMIFGVDFNYKNLVMRPFVGGSYYVLKGFDSNVLNILGVNVGFKGYYSFENTTLHGQVAFLQDFKRANFGDFALLSNGRVLYLGGIASSLEFKFGLEALATRHFKLKGDIYTLYTLSHYNINAGVNLSGQVRF